MMSSDPVVKETVQLDTFKKELRKWTTPVEYRGLLAATAETRRQAFAYHLHSSVDGKGLKHSSFVPCAHEWVSSGTSLMKGAKFNAALGIRFNTLPTRLRAARGRPEANAAALGCLGASATSSRSALGHMVPGSSGTTGSSTSQEGSSEDWGTLPCWNRTSTRRPGSGNPTL